MERTGLRPWRWVQFGYCRVWSDCRTSEGKRPVGSWVYEHGEVDLVDNKTNGSKDLHLHKVDISGRVYRVIKAKDQESNLWKH